MRQCVLCLAVCGMVSLAGAAIPTTGLQLHLDAGSLTGYNNGDTVATWPDLAGGNHNAASAGTPTYVANGLNGMPIIKIDGTSDRNGSGLPNSFDFYTIPPISNVKTIALVFKSTSNSYYTWSPIMAGPTNDNYGWHGDTVWGFAYWDHQYTINSLAYSNMAIDGVSGYNGGWTGLDYDNFRVITIDLYDGNPFDLGFLAHTARYNDTNVHGMEIAELLVYNQHLSAAELEELQFELALKYKLWAAKAQHPTDGQTSIPVNDDLSWLPYNASWGADVYFDPNETNVATGQASAKIVSNQAVSTVDPGTLDFETTYYWRVDLYEPNTVGYILHEGPVWSFTTLPPAPLITTQPVSQTVDAGSLVELSVSGVNIENYQWYLNGTAVSGATGATLQIASLGIADEGVYTCETSNSGSPVIAVSDPAVVVSKRLMGWWKLDQDLTDSVAAVVPGALTHDGSISDPNFAAGLDGGAYAFLQDSRLITIADSTDYFNFYPQGLTVSAWINTAQNGWGGFVSKINSSSTAGFYLEHESDTWLVTGFRGIDGQWSSGEGIYNTWQLVTLTLDADTKTVRQYVNGALTVESAYTVELPLSDESLFFGAEKADGGFSYDGLLDDVRIWSYPLDNIAVAHLYTDLMPGSEVCTASSVFDVTGPAGEPDCRVDFYDFAAAAAEWLNCNLVPTCIN